MTDLKTCPFCGGEDVEHLPDGFGNWLVGCVTCDYRIQCVSCTKDDAIRYWNTRPAEDALKKVIAEIAATLAMGADLPEDDIFAMCKDAIGEKAILDRYNEKLRGRVSKLGTDTDVLTKEIEVEDE